MFDSNSHAIFESEPSIASMIHPSTILDTKQILDRIICSATTSQSDTTKSVSSIIHEMPVMFDSNSHAIFESEPSIASMIHPSTILDTKQILDRIICSATTSQSDTTKSVSSIIHEMPVMFDSNSHAIFESEPSIASMIHPSTILDTTQILESSVLTTSQTDTTESDVSVPLSNVPAASEDAARNSTEIPWNDVVKRRSPI